MKACVFFLLVVLCLLSGCARKDEAPPPTAAATALRFQTDWLPQPEHGGFYQAQEHGFYREAGINVELLPGGPGSQVLQRVALGEIPLGMWRSDDVTVGVTRGLPLVILAAVYQRDPQALMFHTNHPVRGFQDLEGRTVMAGVASIWVKLAERRHGVKITLTPVTFSIARFLNEPDLVQQCLVTSEPYQARKHGADVGTLLVAELGHEPYQVIFANRAWAEANREVALAFVRASIRGWRDFLEGDPALAFAEIARRNPQHDEGSMRYSREQMIVQHLVTGDRAGEAIGRIDPARLERQAANLLEFGLIDRDVRASELLLADFSVE